MKLFVPFFLSALIIVVLNSTGCKNDLSTDPKDLPAAPKDSLTAPIDSLTTPKDSSNTPETHKIYRLSGKVLSEYNIPLTGIKVQINDSVKFSDSNGDFVFYCEANKTVKLQISDSLYLPVKKDLSSSSDFSIVLHLLKVIPDHTYFPLVVGNKWSYKYSSLYYSSNSHTNEEYFNVDWEITAYNPGTNTYDI